MEKWSIYCHTFPNGKRYIGITSQEPTRRWGLQGRGYKDQGYVWNAIQKYGWDNIKHEIIFEVYGVDDAEYYEQYFIALFRSNVRKYGYNIKNGGRFSKGHKMRPEVTKKMGEMRRGTNNWIYGKHLSEETRKKLSLAHMGKCNIEAIHRGAKKRMGGKAYNARKVNCYDMNGNFIKEFNSLADAAREYANRPQDIYNCCIGKQKSSRGRRWQYASEC